jgi:hypothetical protein
MRDAIFKRLDTAFRFTNELSQSTSESSLNCRIAGVPSNSIGSQFWCIIGARESYIKAIVSGGWLGFSCSLTRAQSKEPRSIQSALSETRDQALVVITKSEMSDSQWQLAFDLWEHEILHQGQLVRYFYANCIPFPLDFATRYDLSQPEPRPCTYETN